MSIRLYHAMQNKNIQNIEDSIHILDPSRNMGYWVIKVHTGLFVAPQSSIFCVSLFGLTTAECLQGSVFSGPPTSEEAKHIQGKECQYMELPAQSHQANPAWLRDSWNEGCLHNLIRGCQKANRERGAGTWAMFAKDMPISSLYTAPT